MKRPLYVVKGFHDVWMKSYGQVCRWRALDIVGDRWNLLIVRELLISRRLRFTDLQRGLPGIAPNLLINCRLPVGISFIREDRSAPEGVRNIKDCPSEDGPRRRVFPGWVPSSC